MDWPAFALQALPFLGTLAAFLWGCTRFFRRGVALYLRLIVCAIGCLALGKLFGMVSFLTVGGLPADRFHVGYLGCLGCFLFLFSANFGQMDGLIDDGSPETRKYRYISLAAPLIMLLGALPMLLSSAPAEAKLSAGAVLIPAMLAAYFHLKHLLFPDMGFGFVRAIRPCNISALCLAAAGEVQLIAAVCSLPLLELVSALGLCAACLALIYSAERGTKLWTT